MNTPKQPRPDLRLDEVPKNPDLAEQAVPGHGIPSQDPDKGAQVALSPEEAEREAKSAYVGGGAMAGLAAGAAVGAVVGGPVGVVVGGTAGVIAGVLGGQAAGQGETAETSPDPKVRPGDQIARNVEGSDDIP